MMTALKRQVEIKDGKIVMKKQRIEKGKNYRQQCGGEWSK